MPGSGDSIQALKAGVMEIPDIIVVNKADHPQADTMMREVRAVLSLGPQRSWRVPVVRTEAANGEGIAELIETIDEHRAHIEEEGTLPSAAHATCAPRSSASPPPGCAASSRPAQRRTPSGPSSSTASSGARRILRPPRASC